MDEEDDNDDDALGGADNGEPHSKRIKIEEEDEGEDEKSSSD